MQDREKLLAHKIGKRLKELRQLRGLTQKELARQVSGQIDQSYIGKIERGEQLPSLKMLSRLSESLSVPLVYFFQERENLAGLILQGESLIHLGEKRQRKALLRALRKVHPDDVPFLIEVINILYKHRRRTESGKSLMAAIGEDQSDYGMSQVQREEVLFAIEYLGRLIEGREQYPLPDKEEGRKALRIALDQLKRLVPLSQG